MTAVITELPADDLELAAIVRRVAARHARRVAGLDCEDVSQDIWASMQARWDVLSEQLAIADNEHALFTRMCHRWAQASVVKWRTWSDAQDRVTYDVRRTKLLLATFLHQADDWTGETQEPIGKLSGHSDAAVSGDHLASVMDVSAAWDHLQDRSRAILTGRFRDDTDFSDLADSLAISEAACRKAANRAVEHLADLMTSGCARDDCDLCARRRQTRNRS